MHKVYVCKGQRAANQCVHNTLGHVKVRNNCGSRSRERSVLEDRDLDIVQPTNSRSILFNFTVPIQSPSISLPFALSHPIPKQRALTI